MRSNVESRKFRNHTDALKIPGLQNFIFSFPAFHISPLAALLNRHR